MSSLLVYLKSPTVLAKTIALIAVVKKSDVDEAKPSPVSLMPEGLLKQLHDDEVLDLLAYLLSRGDPQNPMFRR